MAADSHLVVDHASGHVLDAKDADIPRQVASLTKIASAVVLLEWIEESGVDPATWLVTVPQEALRGGANPLVLRAGDEISLETGLFAAMMASDNTSTHAMAAAVGRAIDPRAEDGVAVFVSRMNELARRLGMASTRFVNPHGLDEGSDLGVSTAADLARLAIHFHDRADAVKYCGEKERNVVVLHAGKRIEKRLVNTNELVGSRGIDGTKTGTTRRSGPCLVASATRDLMVGDTTSQQRLVVVVLNAEDRFREAVLLLDRAWPACAEWLAAGGEGDSKQRLRGGGN